MKKLYKIILVLVFLTSSGCHTYKQVNLQSHPNEHSLKVGDNVSIRTVSGEKLKFKIEKIDSEFLYGNHGESVKNTDIISILYLENDPKKTFGLVSIITGAVLVGAFMLNALLHMDGHQ